MIQHNDGFFALHTDWTSYIFGVMPTGQLEHLYYGRRITLGQDPAKTCAGLSEKHVFAPGNSCVYDEQHTAYSLEDVCFEMSGLGKGDIREPFVELINADGSMTTDFVYDHFEVTDHKQVFETLPGAYDDTGRAEHLSIYLKDRNSGAVMILYYDVYPECDVITRRAKLINVSGETLQLRRLMSCQLDFCDNAYRLSTFRGAWAREMSRFDVPAEAGKYVNASYTGTSSNRANSFIMLSRAHTDEDQGECFALNLIYSGNHYEALEVNAYGKLRLVTGINPQGFDFVLEPEASFETPEAVMTFSSKGFNGMSRNMHDFVREHIVRGEWKSKDRPILLNSWEAAYFDINEEKLLNLAKAGKDSGIELFVMDDGWFGHRDDDTSSLGDWYVNTGKLPGGVSGLCEKINALGLDFGIWVEPEMVNVDSDLYRAHPEWAMDIPGKAHSEGRNQRILDLSRRDVQDYIIDEMSTLFSSANITYVKWDMNRIMTDVYSKALPAGRQGEAAHRYVCGLYRCMRELTERFPHILFEGCSGGGNRFDLGILCYFPQIWASDNTDALCRTQIQTGYSYGYPQSVMSAHVSACPNHQTFRTTPLETRFHVAAFGVFGYECNFCRMDQETLAQIRNQITWYKKWRHTLLFGQFYRGRSMRPVNGGLCAAQTHNFQEWTVVSPDQKQAMGLLVQQLTEPNTQFNNYYPKGLDPNALYHFANISSKDSALCENEEQEDLTAFGDALMYAGVKLKAACPSAFIKSDDMRIFPDFASRLYVMEKDSDDF